MLKLTTISNYKEFKNYQKAWKGLSLRSNSDNIFLTYEWIDAFIRHFCSKKDRLLILNVFQDDILIGIAPLMIKRCKYSGLPVKSVCFIGTAISDRMDFIIDGNREEVINLMLDYIVKIKEEWDIIDLREIAEYTGAAAIIRKWLMRTKMNNIFGPRKKSFFINFNGNRDFLFQVFSKKFNNILKKKNSRVKNMNLEFKRYLEDDIGRVGTFSDVSFIEKHSWKGIGEKGIFLKKHESDFHREIFRTFSKKQWVDLYMLSIDKKPAAFVYNYLYGEKSYNYNLAYDKKYSKISPGRILVLWALKDSIVRDISVFDFIRGEGNWKSELTQSFNIHDRIRIYNDSPYPRCIYNLQTKVMPYIRKVKLLYSIWIKTKERLR